MANKFDVQPNEFVVRVAEGLEEKSVPLLEAGATVTPGAEFGKVINAGKPAQAGEDAQRTPAQGKAAKGSGPKAPSAAKVAAARELMLVLGLAGSSDVPELITFTGYVGATYKRGADGEEREWTVLYQDTRLFSWLLIETRGIVDRKPIEDKSSPSGMRDVIWVKADTSVGQGSGSLSVDAQFLTGEFTRAGDFALPAGNGTLSAATGVFCEARSVGCCRPKTNTGGGKP